MYTFSIYIYNSHLYTNVQSCPSARDLRRCMWWTGAGPSLDAVSKKNWDFKPRKIMVYSG